MKSLYLLLKEVGDTYIYMYVWVLQSQLECQQKQETERTFIRGEHLQVVSDWMTNSYVV